MYEIAFVKNLFEKVRCGVITVYDIENKEIANIHTNLIEVYKNQKIPIMRIFCRDVSFSYLQRMAFDEDGTNEVTDEQITTIFEDKQLQHLTNDEYIIYKRIQHNISSEFSDYFAGEIGLIVENGQVTIEFS